METMTRGPRRGAMSSAHALAGLVMVLGIALAVVGVVLLVNQLTQPGGSIVVTVDDAAVEAIPRLPSAPGDAPVALALGDSPRLLVAELPAPLRGVTEAPALLSGVLALVGAWLLRGVLREVAAGRPFADGVAERVGGLAGVAVVAAFVPTAVESLASVLVLEHTGLADASGIGVTLLSVDLGSLLLAAVLVVVAAVVRHGGELARETEGLV
jgi:hypothetical protein